MPLHLAHCFPWVIELVLAMKLPATSVLYGGDRLCLIQIGLLSRVEQTHGALQRQPSILEAALPSSCFPEKIQLVFESNVLCHLVFS
jgi:hypothetical protein